MQGPSAAGDSHAGAVPVDADTTLKLRVNGRRYSHAGDPNMPLLWYLRDKLQLKGTKFGCGIGVCGACTVLLDGAAQRSCQTPLKIVGEREVTTIEGLAGTKLHPVQRAWIEEDVPQCGYCQSGQILAAVDLLRRHPEPDESQINSISNLCRCGTYPRIRRAIKRAAGMMRAK
jgi:isoquinoline 1-oxidoreductase alpha subunit